MQSQKTEGRNGELLPVKIPYNRNEIRRRIESGIPPATAEEYLLRVRYEWKKKDARGTAKKNNKLKKRYTDSKQKKCQML